MATLFAISVFAIMAGLVVLGLHTARAMLLVRRPAGLRKKAGLSREHEVHFVTMQTKGPLKSLAVRPAIIEVADGSCIAHQVGIWHVKRIRLPALNENNWILRSRFSVPTGFEVMNDEGRGYIVAVGDSLFQAYRRARS